MTAEPVHTIVLPDKQMWTLEDLLALPDDGHRYEILDGSLLMSAAPTPWHQMIAAGLVEVLRSAAPRDVMVVEGVAVRIAPHAPVPDVVVGRRAAFGPDAKGLDPKDVLLAVEIVSPSSVVYDRVTKAAMYASAGIPDYWTVDLREPHEPQVVLNVLDSSAYREAGRVSGAESAALDRPFAVTLRPSDLVQWP